MDKTRQKYVFKWLQRQQIVVKKTLYTNVLLGAFSSLILVGQTYCFAVILQGLIIENQRTATLSYYFMGLLSGFFLRAIILYTRERIGFRSGREVRTYIRQQIFAKIREVGPVVLKHKPAGSWATIMLEQVENLHNFYARFLPQQYLSAIVPIVVLIAVFPLNWMAGCILLFTAPLIPLFMILVGMAAADASQKNMHILAKLSGQFLDRLKGLETLRLFNKTAEQTAHIEESTEDFRESTMDVLKKAFLSSAVLEFFTSISIALMAVYFGFSYLGKLHFGDYGVGISLFAGFFCLILAPEFYQPLRDLGTYYHDRASAIGAGDVIVAFLEQDFTPAHAPISGKHFPSTLPFHIEARDLVVLSPDGTPLTLPLTFTLPAHSLTALVGQSGAGKTSIINTLLGFLTYQGRLTVNGVELRELNLSQWREQIAWVGQNPLLLPATLRQNLTLGGIEVSESALQNALREAQALEFVEKIGLNTEIHEQGAGLSVGQAQRLAIARALLRQSKLLLLDEPTASLDARSETLVLQALDHLSRKHCTLMVTHRIEELKQCDQILVMKAGEIVQQGTFQQLENTGFFAELLAYRQQDIQ